MVEAFTFHVPLWLFVMTNVSVVLSQSLVNAVLKVRAQRKPACVRIRRRIQAYASLGLVIGIVGLACAVVELATRGRGMWPDQAASCAVAQVVAAVCIGFHYSCLVYPNRVLGYTRE